MTLVHGVGINDRKYPSVVKGKAKKEYQLWVGMIGRGCSQKVKSKYPAYKDCSVSENFKNYSYFYEWCYSQIGFGLDGWHLDKDIIRHNNKVYSEDVCVFVPHQINPFFEASGASRGDYPIGVSFEKARGKYEAYCRANGKKHGLGRFASPELAHDAYKDFKEKLCKELANKWRCQIDNSVYDAMMVWSVEL